MIGQKEVLSEAVRLGGKNKAKSAESIGMNKENFYPRVQGRRSCSWEEMNVICNKLCGKTAFSIATSLSIKKEVASIRESQ